VGQSQDDLARALGVPVSTINDFELGRTEIPLPQLEILADTLHVSMTYFLDQGIKPSNGSNGQVTSLDDIVDYTQLPQDVKVFLSNPANLLYINIAMKLSKLSADTLRALAEGLLEVTY
jgi:transcriptional regulator with XRE-family HTH domain